MARRPARVLSVLFTLAGVVGLGFAGGLVVSGRLSMTSPSAADQTAPVQPPPSRPAVTLPVQSALPDLSAVAEAALKSAANISSTTTVRTGDDVFSQFWGMRPRTQRSQSLGSGVVVSSDGYVLTNNHVIGDARADIRVTLADGVERPGRLIGVDDVTDLALVKVAATNLPTLPWGDSSRLRIAEWVLAIGNPYQLSGTVTLGIVSATNRSGAQVGTFANVIQTDAAINPGNSGGALINARGELVGINSMIYSRTGGYQGIGFAIPSNDAKAIMDQLRTTGSVSWGDIGYVEWYDVNPDRAEAAGIGRIAGVLAYDLDPESSAYRGGLRPSDIVLSFNGAPTPTSDQLTRLMEAAKISSVAKVEVLRNGRRMTLDITIIKRQPTQSAGR